MPAGGGDPKVIGDGQVVWVRVDWSRGGADLWDTRDIIVALCEELDNIYGAVAANAAYADFRTAVAAGRTFIQLGDKP